MLPPLVAIGLALWLRQVLPALFVGIWIGAWALAGFSFDGLFRSLLNTADTFIRDAVAEPDHASVMLFTLLVGGMVGIISRNGGMLGIVEHMARFASNARRTMASTMVLGLAIFFDDYANTLVVGNTMRPVSDRMRISREKLAYLVDSTAAPVACVALITTWVGYEVGLIRDALGNIPDLDLNAYLVFLNSIAYSFYPVLALVLVAGVVATGRDFGPMLGAERRARNEGQVAPPSASTRAQLDAMADLQPDEQIAIRARNALIPMVVLIGGVIGGMLASGEGGNLREIVGSADPYLALIWGSLGGTVVAIALSVATGALSLEDAVAAWFGGARAMLYAIMILVLAWALSGVTQALDTAGYLVLLVGDGLHPGLLPAVVFVVAAATAFSTGSSWGAMGILLPLVVPLAWALLGVHDMASTEHLPILYGTVAAVLGGAVWGDHCSPISDTTILSSMATQCDHIEHVRTQLPYAMLAGGSALLLGALPAGFGVPWYLCMLLGALAVVGLLYRLGRLPAPA